MNLSKIVTTVVAVGGIFLGSSCGSKTYMSSFAPEESGLNVVKITDEAKGSILGSSVSTGFNFGRDMFSKTLTAGNRKSGITWSTTRLLKVSPNGDEIAYLTRANKQDNIMVRKSTTGGAATQRTFRNVGSFDWGNDDNLYFNDIDGTQSKICFIDAHKGSLMRQLTSSNSDHQPVLSNDKKKVFFTRYESNGGASIWSYDLSSGELTNCARGYQPTMLGRNNNEFICVRNNDEGTSEIWKVNYVDGQETLLLSDKERGYSHPAVSPDGKWLLVVGNTVSSINKKKNLDIFAFRLDGSSLVQLTYHPAQDTNPQWSADGKSIYFISSRATEDESYNIWKINFNM